MKTYAVPAELVGRVGALLDNLRAIPASSVTRTASFALDNSERGLDRADDKAFRDTIDLALVLESYGMLSRDWEETIKRCAPSMRALVVGERVSHRDDGELFSGIVREIMGEPDYLVFWEGSPAGMAATGEYSRDELIARDDYEPQQVIL